MSMQSYGKFQAVRELYQTPLGAVWAARPVGDEGPPLACIKLIQPESAVFEGGGVAAAKEMLVAAAIQQSIANKAENWAPIYELGYDGQTAFYVTKLYDRSLQRLIAAKAKFSSDDLLTIISAIVDGLTNLYAAHERPHGNLKPANVLLAGKGRIRRESVVLTDPYPGDPDVPSANRSPDGKALGEIIFSLVTNRPYTVARWPVQTSPEWNRLGRTGPQWLALCNDLLNTMARQGAPSLESIQFRLHAMGRGSRGIPPKWIAVAAMVGLISCGWIYRKDVQREFGLLKGKFAKAVPTHVAPATRPMPVVSNTVIHPPIVPPIPKPPAVIVVPPAPVVIANNPPPAPPNPVTLPVIPTPIAVPTVEVKTPGFLPPGAAKKFSDVANNPSKPLSAAEQAKFVQAVAMLEPQYPKPAIGGQEPWQIKLQASTEQKWDDELTAAVVAVAEQSAVDPSRYTAYLASIVRFNKEATASESAVNAGVAWSGANGTMLETAVADKINLFDDSIEGTQVTPMVLQEAQRISSAHDSAALHALIHDESLSLPSRVAAWQRLCDPQVNANWPRALTDFVQDQTDGEGLIKTADAEPVLKQSVSDLEDLRLKSFYSTLTTQPLLTDAIEHVAEVEGQRSDKRPAWFDFDLVLYKLKAAHAGSMDELQKFKSAADVPEFAVLQGAMAKVLAVAGTEQPLGTVGPAVLKDWAVRSDRSGCTYTNESGNLPAVEFIRVPATGKAGCTEAFYLSTTNVTIELISALLDNSGSAASRANAAVRHLNHADRVQAPAGVRPWRFKDQTGIELDRDNYAKYFSQGTDDPRLPMQQITPQAAMYLARSLGCRLPTSAEWQAAWGAAANSADDRVKRFALSAWKLRDADFISLVQKAVENSSALPDEGLFLGAAAASSPVNAKAIAWPTEKVHALGGWTLAERSTDFGRAKIAEMGTISDDIGLDLLDPPESGFRPVGNAQDVFHDLIGNVAEFVLDAPGLVSDQLSAGDKVAEKQINDWFAAPDRMQQLGVIGGSFLSPPELDPRVRQVLPSGENDLVFADVGFRLAFTDPKEYSDPATVIRNAPYAYPREQIPMTKVPNTK